MTTQSFDIADSDIHAGHRGRMREKLLLHGERIFDTYELLEMLLYHSIPYKDTNPLAKRLLHRFGGLDGVFTASAEDLCEVNGVGNKTAKLIKLVDRLSSVIGAEIVPLRGVSFSDYTSSGRNFVNYFSDKPMCRTVAAFLDNSMNLIAFEGVFDLDFSSGGVRAKPFIDLAIKHRAAVVITAHNHPHGPFYPSDGDRASGEMLTDALSRVGILHAEHFLVCGSSFAGISAPRNFIGRFSQSTKAVDFYDSKLRSVGSVKSDGVFITDVENVNEFDKDYNVRDLPYLTELLSYATSNAEGTAECLMKKYRTIEGGITAFSGEVKQISDHTVACFMKLIGYLTARRREEKLTIGEKHSEVEIVDYLKAKFLGQASEQVYLLSFDEKGAFLKVDFVCEGTVNVADVLPRRILEIAVMCGASGVSLAHNHPFGTPMPSSDDIAITANLYSVLMSAEITLGCHYVVAGQLCNVIDAEDGLT